MGVETNNVFEAQDRLSSSDFVQNDQRSARNLMVITRKPEDRSKAFKNLRKPSEPYTPVCVHL
eukprot:6515407-Heterocapsa_arctica.AAC.1